MSSVAVLVIIAGGVWILLKIVGRTKSVVAGVRKRSSLIWIALAVIAAITLATYR